MYNLAKRQGLPKIGDTPDHVAANTYLLEDYKICKENFAPFLSNTRREFSIGQKLYTQAVYNTNLPKEHIKGGSSVRNKSARTFLVKSDSPGPADYDPKKITKKKPLPSNEPPPGKGKLYLCTPPHFLQAVPTIPTRADENGYYVDENGELVKIPPDEFDTTLGPAFYEVRTKPFFATNKYKGCEWSKRRASRSTVDISTNPGPGTYSIPTEIGQMNTRDEYVRAMARLFTYIPRTLEANEIRILKENIPGPGQYDNNKSTLKGHKNEGIYPPPFIVGSKRFTVIEPEAPAPNCYNLQNYPKRRTCSLLSTPFGVEASRYSKQFYTYGPGPAAYTIRSPMEENTKKLRNCYSSVSTSFNTTAKRKMDFVERDAPYMPGPANYIVEPLEIPKRPISCCHFKSTTDRFPELDVSENAEPATYSISETFNKNRNRTSHNTGKVPFQSRQPKCTEGISDNPSPADYLGHEVFAGRSLSFNRAPRFKYCDEEFPGPGSYQIEPQYNDSVYKSYATNNLRLKENVLRQSLRLPPGKTWDTWYKQLKQKKKLKCYENFEKRMYDYVGMLFKGINTSK